MGCPASCLHHAGTCLVNPGSKGCITMHPNSLILFLAEVIMTFRAGTDQIVHSSFELRKFFRLGGGAGFQSVFSHFFRWSKPILR
jgi:hypothetical protein